MECSLLSKGQFMGCVIFTLSPPSPRVKMEEMTDTGNGTVSSRTGHGKP